MKTPTGGPGPSAPGLGLPARTEGAPLTPTPAIPRRAQALIALLAVGVVTLGAMVLAGPSPETAETAAASAGHTIEVPVSVRGMSFTPSTIEVPAGDRLVITFTNTGDQRHDLVLASGAWAPRSRRASGPCSTRESSPRTRWAGARSPATARWA